MMRYPNLHFRIVNIETKIIINVKAKFKGSHFRQIFAFLEYSEQRSITQKIREF